MQDIIELLKEASALLIIVEDDEPIDHHARKVMSNVYMAHARIKQAEGKLHRLVAEKHED